jgi:hypothetical protein
MQLTDIESSQGSVCFYTKVHLTQSESKFTCHIKINVDADAGVKVRLHDVYITWYKDNVPNKMTAVYTSMLYRIKRN